MSWKCSHWLHRSTASVQSRSSSTRSTSSQEPAHDQFLSNRKNLRHARIGALLCVPKASHHELYEVKRNLYACPGTSLYKKTIEKTELDVLVSWLIVTVAGSPQAPASHLTHLHSLKSDTEIEGNHSQIKDAVSFRDSEENGEKKNTHFNKEIVFNFLSWLKTTTDQTNKEKKKVKKCFTAWGY